MHLSIHRLCHGFLLISLALAAGACAEQSASAPEPRDAEAPKVGPSRTAELPAAFADLKQVIAAKQWGSLRPGFDPLGTAPSDPRAAEIFASVRTLLGVCDEVRARWNVDRSQLFRDAAAARDAEAWQRASCRLAYDTVRVQITDNVKEQLASPAQTAARVKLLQEMYDEYLAPLVQAQTARGPRGRHRGSVINSYLRALTDASLTAAAAPRGAQEYANAGLAFLEELGQVISLESRQASASEPLLDDVQPTVAGDLISTAVAANRAAVDGSWADLSLGWTQAAARARGELVNLQGQGSPGVRAGRDLHRTCELVREQMGQNYVDLMAQSIQARSRTHVTTTILGLGYEILCMQLMGNVAAQLAPRDVCTARQDAAGRLFELFLRPVLDNLKSGDSELSSAAQRALSGYAELRLPDANPDAAALAAYREQVTELTQDLSAIVRAQLKARFIDASTGVAPSGQEAKPAGAADSVVDMSPASRARNAGETSLAAGDFAAAEVAFRESLRLAPGDASVRDQLEFVRHQLAERVGSVAAGEPFLEDFAKFQELSKAALAAAAAGSWIQLLRGINENVPGAEQPPADQPADAATETARNIRHTLAAIYAETGRDRRDLFRTAIQDESPENLARALLVVTFELARAQVSSNLRDELKPVDVVVARHAYLRAAVAHLIEGCGSLGVEVSAEDRADLEAGLAALADEALIPQPVDAQASMKVRDYGIRAMPVIDGLIELATPLLVAASAADIVGGAEVGGELPDLVEVASAAHAAAVAGSWKEIADGYATGGEPKPTADGSPNHDAFSTGQRLRQAHDLVNQVFELDRGELLQAALSQRLPSQLDNVVAVMAFDAMRLQVSRNLRSRLLPNEQAVARARNISEIYYKLLRPRLVPEGTTQAQIEADRRMVDALGRLGSDRLLGSKSSPPLPQDYGIAAVAMLQELAQSLSDAKILPRATAVPREPFRADDPGAFLALLATVKAEGTAGNWRGLDLGLRNADPDDTIQGQEQAYEAGRSLAARAAEIDARFTKQSTTTLAHAVSTRTQMRLEGALLELAFDTIRLLFVRNLADSFEPREVAAARISSIVRIYDDALGGLVRAIAGRGNDSGYQRDFRIRKLLLTIEEVQRAAIVDGTMDDSEHRTYERLVLELLDELAAAVTLIDPLAAPLPVPQDAGQAAGARFHAEDPAEFLQIAAGLRAAARRGEWQDLSAGFHARAEVAPTSPSGVKLGDQLRARLDEIDGLFNKGRTQFFAKILTAKQVEGLDRATIVLALDSILAIVQGNVDDHLLPAETAAARTRTIVEIYETELKSVVLADPGDPKVPDSGGTAAHKRVRDLLASMSAERFQGAEPDYKGYLAVAGDVIEQLSHSISRLPTIPAASDSQQNTATDLTVEEGDPESYLAIIRGAREAVEGGFWGELGLGFQRGGAPNGIDSPARAAGRGLRRRAEALDVRDVNGLRAAIQDAKPVDLEGAILFMTFHELRSKVTRNMWSALRPYDEARARNNALLDIYHQILGPIVVKSPEGGERKALELRTSFTSLNEERFLGSAPGVEPQIPADPKAYGESAADTLLELFRVLSAYSPPQPVVVEGQDHCSQDNPELEASFDSKSSDFFIIWGVDKLRYAVAHGCWDTVLAGFMAMSDFQEIDSKPVRAGKVIRAACEEIHKSTNGRVNYEEAFEKALRAHDQADLSRMLILLCFQMAKLRVNANLVSNLEPYEAVAARHDAVETLWKSVLKAAYYSDDPNMMQIAQGHDLVIQSALTRMREAGGEKVDKEGVAVRVATDTQAYRQHMVSFFEYLSIAIQSPADSIKKLELGPEPEPKRDRPDDDENR